jgi:hypothetical protein
MQDYLAVSNSDLGAAVGRHQDHAVVGEDQLGSRDLPVTEPG